MQNRAGIPASGHFDRVAWLAVLVWLAIEIYGQFIAHGM
jgi:hypothetical protein